MKASMKFREEKNPLLRAKIPLSILGLPFQSGIVAGESKELSLNLSTFFESGPSLKLAYRPNDSHSPFSLVVKTGTGPFGSPISTSMLMSAEFNLLGNKNSPTFMLHFKPRFGDFSIKKSHSSSGLIGSIGIEHVDGCGGGKETKPVSDPGKVSGLRNSEDVCLVMEELRSENRELKRAVEDLRGVMVSNVRPFYPATVDYGSHSKYREAERSNHNNSNNGRARGERWSSERTTSDYGGKKSKEDGDVAEELKKALKGAA
ncbi:hypothetical protein HID58_060750 [Brassica napus]|uniref:Uncharacterized protein n=1 Tax=Brassica napus TaxID=3708 RepID=A0ABQ7ZWL0_BRANA|nr:hypothetical protein HID58_060750 [Brassica napus]